MKNKGKMIRSGELEFFLRLHGLWEGVIALPPPPETPFDIESIERLDDPPVWVWAGETEPPPAIWWECGARVNLPPAPPELDLGDGRILVFDADPIPEDDFPVIQEN